jgi:hypothetical protein
MFRRNSAIFMEFIHQYLKLSGTEHITIVVLLYSIGRHAYATEPVTELPLTHSISTHDMGTRAIMDQY